VVLASSAAVYGEASDRRCGEEDEARPISPYGLHKLINEQYATLYHRVGWVETVALRYFNVYGPRQDPAGEYAAVVPRFVTAALEGTPPLIFGDGRQSRDFMFVEDVARANLLAMETPAAAGRVLNVCAGRETSLLDLVENLSRVIGAPVKPRFRPAKAGDIRRSCGRDENIRALLEPGPWLSLTEGLRRTVKWFGNE